MLSYKNFKPNLSRDKGKAPETPALEVSTSAPAAKTEDTKSPILSPDDECFLSEELGKVDESNVIFPGCEEASGATTPVEPATPAAPAVEPEVKTTTPAVPADEPEVKTTTPATPAVEPEVKTTTPAAPVVEPEVKTTEKTKILKTDELMGAITTQWDGLKRTVSSAAEQHRKKSAEKSAEEAAKKEEKRKLKKAKEKKKVYERPEDELTDALEQLNLTAEEGRALALSAETKALLGQFTQILKDIGNGAPTAYKDLTSLLDTSSKQLEETFTGLPSFLQKLIKTLPAKLKPELLQAAAAASPALATEGGFKALVTQPGALMSLLKSVVNILKLRFPMALGANAALSMGLFVVLLVLWYFYKRGKEVRLEKEEKERLAAATLAEAEGPATAATTATTATTAAATVSGTEQDLQGENKC